MRPRTRRPRARAWSALAAMVIATTANPATTGATDAAGFELEVPVLMYHRIKAQPPSAPLPGLFVRPRRFAHHMRALHEAGWRSMTSAELWAHLRHRVPVGRKRFVVTFDDGARDGLVSAAPVLERHGMRGTFCVVPGRRHLAWQLDPGMLRELHDRGHEIANHSYTHANLPALAPRALRRQIGRAQATIERIVGIRPVTMCYPYGNHSRRVRKAAGRAGIRIGYTTAHGASLMPASRLRTPRIRVSGWDSADDLVRKLRPYRGRALRYRPAPTHAIVDR